MKRPRTVRLHSATSTQDIARGLPIGSVVVADFQTAGRGRLDHRWEAPPGTALLVSFVLAPNPVLSLAEDGVSGALSITALIWPAVAAVLVVLVLVEIFLLWRRWRAFRERVRRPATAGDRP